MKKRHIKGRSTILFSLILIFIVVFAYIGSKGIEIAGWEFKMKMYKRQDSLLI